MALGGQFCLDRYGTVTVQAYQICIGLGLIMLLSLIFYGEDLISKVRLGLGLVRVRVRVRVRVG